jgi:hypothetical protein
LADRSDGQPDPDQILAEQILGPCPFPPGHDRYKEWIGVALGLGAAVSQMKAEGLARAETASVDQLKDVAVDLFAGYFDIGGNCNVWAVAHGMSVVACENQFAKAKDYLMELYDRTAAQSPRPLDPALRQRVKLRLDQRVHHWTSQARRAGLTYIAATQTQSPPLVPATAAPTSPDVTAQSPEDRGARRAAVIEPILKNRGLTRGRWAAKAGVDPSVVYDFLAGKSNPRPESRNVLAEVLGIEELPE